jgi:hypothetical protein
MDGFAESIPSAAGLQMTAIPDWGQRKYPDFYNVSKQVVASRSDD